MNKFDTPEQLLNYLEINENYLHSVLTGERGAFALQRYMEINNISRVISSGKINTFRELTIPIKVNATLTIDQNADSRSLESENHDDGGIQESYIYYIISRPYKKKNP